MVRARSDLQVLSVVQGLWQQFPQFAEMFPDPANFAAMLRQFPVEAMQIVEDIRQGRARGGGNADVPGGVVPQPPLGGAAGEDDNDLDMPGGFEADSDEDSEDETEVDQRV